MIGHRDIIIDEILKKAKKDKKIFFLSADFGAPALDRYRKLLPNQFLHLGISEQNMVGVAAGLSLKGCKVFIYAMAPFVSLRCLEQHKSITGIMNLPITTIVSGVGLGYADAGPTHYATDDFASLNSISGSTIYTASDISTTKNIINNLLKNPKFSFLRIDREAFGDFKMKKKSYFKYGFNIYTFKEKNYKKCILTNGYQLKRVLNYLEKKPNLKDSFFVIDLFQTKPINRNLIKFIRNKEVYLIDEQVKTSSFFLNMAVNFSNDFGKVFKIKNFSLSEKFIFENGGREKLLNDNGLKLSKIFNQ